MGLHQFLTLSSLIVGTTIGAGMLSLPLICQGLSWVMLLVFFSLSAFIMKTSACYLVEIKKKFQNQDNLITYLKATYPQLIWPTKAIYLLFLWSLLAFYLSALAKASSLFLSNFSLAQSFYSAILILFLTLSTQNQGRFNKMFVFIMFLALFSVLGILSPNLNITTFSHQLSQTSSFNIFGILLTSFGFHHIIPSLSNYEQNLEHQKKAITLSILIIVFVYLLWVCSILSLSKSENITLISPLDFLSNSHENLALKNFLLTIFSFFASLTSSIGVSIGVHDFLKDIYHSYHLTNTSSVTGEREKNLPQLSIILLTVLPSLTVSVFTGESFLAILSLGSYLGLYLLVFIPCLIHYKIFNKRKSFFIAILAFVFTYFL